MTTQPIPQHELLREKSLLKTLTVADWLFAACIAAIGALIQIKLPHHMVFQTDALVHHRRRVDGLRRRGAV